LDKKMEAWKQSFAFLWTTRHRKDLLAPCFFKREKFGVDDSQIEIDFILSKVGLAESFIKAKVYDEKREVKKVEAQPVKSEQSPQQ
jgi:hypothetical protein